MIYEWQDRKRDGFVTILAGFGIVTEELHRSVMQSLGRIRFDNLMCLLESETLYRERRAPVRAAIGADCGAGESSGELSGFLISLDLSWGASC